MADGRGGYRQPPSPQPPSGPGRFSKRTDGNQGVKTPPLAGSDLQYGDVQRLQAGQQAAPVPRQGEPRVAGGPPAQAPSSAGPEGGLPDWLLQMPSARPAEPVTAGLALGAGPGPEMLQSQGGSSERELVLSYLASTYNNPDAVAMLREMRDQGAQPPLMQPAVPGAVPAQPVPGSAPLADFLLGPEQPSTEPGGGTEVAAQPPAEQTPPTEQTPPPEQAAPATSGEAP